MEPKFKIGDKVYSTVSKNEYTIVEVILGRKEIFGCWLSERNPVMVENGYVLQIANKTLSWASIGFQDSFVLIVSEKENCPRCGMELFDKVSEYTGEMVKKCKCGWC